VVVGVIRRIDCYGSEQHPCFGGPLKILRYLGRHMHGIAISNHRLLAFDGERVTFRWKDYARGGKQLKMTLLGTEFLRRFFLHVLPKGFVRIPEYPKTQTVWQDTFGNARNNVAVNSS
jgi:hypothetical protein